MPPGVQPLKRVGGILAGAPASHPSLPSLTPTGPIPQSTEPTLSPGA